MIARALERELIEAHRLPLAEYDVLVQLNDAEGGALRMAQLADRVLLSRSGLTRLVERLEHSGLVRREVCPSDARGYFAVLTDLGRERLLEAAPSHLRSVRTHFSSPLTADQIESLSAALEQLLASMPSECDSPPPQAGVEQAEEAAEEWAT